MDRLLESNSPWLHLPTPLGLVLVIAGISVLTNLRLALLLLFGTALLIAVIIGVAVLWRRRSGKPVERDPRRELSDWRRFVANRRRWAPLETALYGLIVAFLIWSDGLSLGTILIAAGFACLLVARWLIEPRTWAEATRRLTAPRA